MWQRLLIGDGPWAFVLEAVWRGAFMYVLLLIFMRMMGKRVAAQLTTNERAVVLMLGAAIGVPIQVSSQGMLPAAVVLMTTLVMQRGLARYASRHERFEAVSQGDVCTVLEDGRLMLEQIAQVQMSRELLASELRSRGIQHLGELRRVYLEASGGLSLLRYREARPGLSLSPGADGSLRREARVPGRYACWGCGHTIEAAQRPEKPCAACGCAIWHHAVRRLADT